MNALDSASTRPYLIRALYEWCNDNGLTPYLAVRVDDSVRVPREYVKDGEIVLNISAEATSALRLGNEFIEFKARFGGVAREILVPVGRVVAIFSRENGQGMAFPVQEQSVPAELPGTSPEAGAAGQADARVVQLVSTEKVSDGPGDEDPPRPPPGPRPALKRVK